MSLQVHILNVDQGNMSALLFPDGSIMVIDCNITQENEKEVFRYLASIMTKTAIDVFVNSHRDSDHMRGIKKLHKAYPISTLWEAGVSANTDAPEYQEYMDFRRNLLQANVHEVSSGQYWIAHPYVRIINGKRPNESDLHLQSLVLHIDYKGSAILFPGDSNSIAWEDYIMPESGTTVGSLVLVASHHGSDTFFNDRGEESDDFVDHVNAIAPAITVISVGKDNPFGHPDQQAVSYYEQVCYGTVETKQKIFRTDLHGNMRIDLHGDGTGTIYWNQ